MYKKKDNFKHWGDNMENYCNCSEIYNCCDCGNTEGYGCGCAYCWSCNACEDCLSEYD